MIRISDLVSSHISLWTAASSHLDQIIDANTDNISTKFSTLRYRRGLAYSSARSISRTLVSNEIAQS